MRPPPIARRLRDGQLESSPIREIMKLADPGNIIRMGLDPDDVISFAGGWVAHRAPEGVRAAYAEISDDPALFHDLGAYSPTRGLPRTRSALLALDRAVYRTEGLADEHVLVGASSTQLTHSLLTTLLDPGDRVVLFDPSYANYGPQLDLGPQGIEVLRLPVLDAASGTWMADPEGVATAFRGLLEQFAPRLLLFSSPNNPTGRLVPDDVFTDLVESAGAGDCWVIVDFAYRAQCFVEPEPAHFSASPVRYPNLIRLHSNSKWCRGLGRRLGWVEADPVVIEALEIVQQSTALCPDSVHQYALAVYLERALADGSLGEYVGRMSTAYRRAGAHTARCVREYLHRPCTDPEGGLYTVVGVGRDGDAFAKEVLAKTGVILVPGAGFGPSLTEGVRISYGPLVNDLDRIEEGLRRVGSVM
jgi:aspartate/methionine/tyrosine aminotransferase